MVAKNLRYKFEHPEEKVSKPTPTVFVSDGKNLVKVKDVIEYGSVRLLLPSINN